MEPFPATAVMEILDRSSKSILIENNATGQLGDLIQQKTGCKIHDRILKYNGRQFFKDELVNLIEQKL
jgi:2-oxoglutarate ferredoxin oxidoreductase subunit alpha